MLVWLGLRAWSAESEPRAAVRTEQATLELGAAEEPGALADVADGAEGRVEAQGSSAGTREAVQAAATLAVHVVHERDGADASGVGLTLWPEDDALAELHALELETDVLGHARFEGVPSGRYRVSTDRDGVTPLELAAMERTRPALLSAHSIQRAAAARRAAASALGS